MRQKGRTPVVDGMSAGEVREWMRAWDETRERLLEILAETGEDFAIVGTYTDENGTVWKSERKETK